MSLPSQDQQDSPRGEKGQETESRLDCTNAQALDSNFGRQNLHQQGADTHYALGQSEGRLTGLHFYRKVLP